MKTLEEDIAHFWSRVDIRGPDECWTWLGGIRGNGHGLPYGAVWFQGENVRSHVLAYQLTKGKVPNGKCVLHTCDNPPCCNPRHLFAGTRGDNIRDCVAKGRHVVIRTLSVEQVSVIRELISSGTPQRTIAAQFGVSQTTISGINTGKWWRCA